MDLRKTVLSSKRLSLKAFAPDDAAEIFAAVTPTLTRFMAFEPSPSLDAFASVWGAWLPQMAAGMELLLVVRSKSAGEFLGIAGLHGIGNPEPETGIWIKVDKGECPWAGLRSGGDLGSCCLGEPRTWRASIHLPRRRTERAKPPSCGRRCRGHPPSSEIRVYRLPAAPRG